MLQQSKNESLSKSGNSTFYKAELLESNNPSFEQPPNDSYITFRDKNFKESRNTHENFNMPKQKKLLTLKTGAPKMKLNELLGSELASSSTTKNATNTK